MGYAERYEVSLTTAADGSCTAYSPVVSGAVSQLRYVKTDFTDGVDFTITAEATGETIWSQLNVNASTTVAPRQPTHSTAGVAALYAVAGTAVNDKIILANDRIKIVIASGGDTHTGAIHIIME